MSIISANTLFHFTHNKDTLLKIIETGFRPSFCEEHGPTGGLSNFSIHIPMVSFCDIPLSMLDKHMNGYEWSFAGNKQYFKGYGQFGLGMTKDWGIKKMLNPVAYTNYGSTFHAGLLESNLILGRKGTEFNAYYESLENIDNPVGPLDYHKKVTRNFVDQFRKALFFTSMAYSCVKPYQSKTTGQRYYDEKEWRYVPIYQEKNEFGTFDIMVPTVPETMPDYQSLIVSFKQMINDHLMLQFEPEDIKYIIVNNDNDVKDVVEQLESLSTKFSESDRNRLISRIITCEQIREDF